MQTVVIEPRFSGPPRSGHGGYVAGLVANEVGNPAEVTLRTPPPLGRELTLESTAEGDTVLCDGHIVVAEGRRCDTLDVVAPAVVRWADAEQAAAHFLASSAEHPFRTCFGCGPERAPGDGLRTFFGPVAGHDGLFAAPFVPDPSLVRDADGTADEVAPEFVWAAIDCPSAAPVMFDGTICVLGRLAVQRRGQVRLGYRYVVTSWLEARSGRKAQTAAALCTDMGNVQAVARATWIEVDVDTFN
jgi:hypothetical protein